MQKRLEISKLFTVSAVAIALLLVYFFADARYSSIFPRCPFYMMTGLYCPGCGSQRALSSLLHGQLLQAMNYNLLLILSLPLLLYSATVKVINVFKAESISQKIFHSSLFIKIFVAVIVLFWILRNIKGYPFSLLAPHQL